VNPSNATFKTITWSITNAGSTQPTLTGSTITFSQTGTATLAATIKDGLAINQPYIQNFDIVVTSTFVPVTDITNLPSQATVNQPLTLSGTVNPQNATFQTITWSIANPGTTNPTLTGSTFTATQTGTATLLATILDGKEPGTPFTKTFSIKVEGGVNIDEQGNTLKLKAYPNPTTGKLTIEVGDNHHHRVLIMNISGTLIELPYIATNEKIQVDLSPLMSGIYILQIGNQSVKIVKE